MHLKRRWVGAAVTLTGLTIGMQHVEQSVTAQTAPTVVDPDLAVRTVIDELTTPIGMEFLDDTSFFVLEKNTGRVIRVSTEAPETTVLDLAVNAAGERGLLGMALHPDFPSNPRVYLYWTESSTGADTTTSSQTPLLGNRVDRYNWNGTILTFDRNIIRFRSQQQDEGQGHLTNHNGGVIRFGPDGKLYIFVGDVGRRGQMQNLPDGPFGPGQDDDQYGGPDPDDVHFTSVIVRLNANGTTPTDNPFHAHGGVIGGEVGTNIQRIFSYGHRNGFGMTFDPVTGALWMTENGDDTFSELNRVLPGMNGGWIQVAGPIAKVKTFKKLEKTIGGGSLQQSRWPPMNIAGTPDTALARLFMLDGAHYADPAFSWKYEVAPAAVGFLTDDVLGASYLNDLFMGAATGALQGGYLFKFDLNSSREKIKVSDARLKDRLANNTAKHDITESESLLFGSNFGVVTDILTAPSGHLFLVSLSHGTVYEVYRD